MMTMMMMVVGMLIMTMIDFQVEIDTARGVVDTSSGISRYSIQRLNPLSTKNVFRAIFINFMQQCTCALPSYILSFLRLGVRHNCSSGLSDDEPLYDSVASDDDYYTIQVGRMVMTVW